MSAERIVAKMALFDQIYLPYPPHIAFHNDCKYLLELGIATRGRPQKGMRALAPSGSGKTSAALSFIRQYQAKNPRTQTSVPIVYVALERAATAKKLMISILEYFGDSYAAHGNEQALKKRVIACFQRFGTLLLIIDEAQHLNYRVYEKNDVTDSLKRLLDEGVVPIVFIGTKDAEDLFTRNVQLSSRLISPCDFEPLDLTVQADRSLLSGYVTLLDQALVEKRILPNSSGLADPAILTRLFLVADGVIGRVSRLLTVALEIALRRGAEKIEWQDLALAVDRWAIPNGLTGKNPFLQEDAL